MSGAAGDPSPPGFLKPTLDVPEALVDAYSRWKEALRASDKLPSLAPDKNLLNDAFQLLQRKLPTKDLVGRAEVLGAGVKAVRLVFNTRKEALGFVVHGLRLARHRLTLPPDFVERTFAHQTRGWSALEAAVIVAFVAQPPPDAPARQPGDTFVYFRVDLPDGAGPCFVAWLCEPDLAQGEKRIKDALLRFTEGAPPLLQLSQEITLARVPTNNVEYNQAMKEIIDRTLATAASTCFGCGASTAQGVKLLKCTRCTGARYCGVECQRKDWRRHKMTECPDLLFLMSWHQQVYNE